MKFRKEFMQDMVWEDNPDTTVIEDTIEDTSRWSEHHRVIFEYEGKFYSSYYSKGLTEYQDESPYENDSDEIECAEVHQVEEMVKVWRRV
jgi:hypothetical protein